MSSISQSSMPRSLFKQLYCEMFAFSAFDRGPHTEYYFILQGDGGGGGGLWKRLHFWAVIIFDYNKTLFKIKRRNLAHRHTNTSCDSRLKENLFTEKGRAKKTLKPFARAKCTTSSWFMGVRSQYLGPNESAGLMLLLGGLSLSVCLCSATV